MRGFAEHERERERLAKSAEAGGQSHTSLGYLCVVAVPDPCIQDLIQQVLGWAGYPVACTPIDRLHPLGWIAEAIRAQPEVLIVDVDLFQHRSVQETLVLVKQSWEDESCRRPPGWIWLSRRFVGAQETEILRMPFHLAQLDAHLQRAYQTGYISVH